MTDETLKKYLEIREVFLPLQEEIYGYCYNIFMEKYPPRERKGAMWFDGYKVIDENTIEIKYGFGGGDQEMQDSFIHTINIV